ncbi:GtrA family protein [Chryseobacterium taklimakanense]|uniref:GtrA family protein n=1 Tax=Chryseobacterium taklimakanense TaxID=536441 RepID=UPI001EF59FAA|nr:GtrA family protein [Chryseobacterium taklimakanense]MCG7281828.1 GtrA family protein [Chryseobacterium taklimakanense]
MKQLLLGQKQVLFFVLAGAMSAVIEVGTFKFFSVQLPPIFAWEKNLYGVHFPLSNILSTSCGIISNYFFSIWFVFERGKHSKRREFAYFIAISAVSTVLSLMFFQIFYSSAFRNEYFDLGFFVFSPEMLSKIAAIVLVSVLNYSVKKRIIFSG